MWSTKNDFLFPKRFFFFLQQESSLSGNIRCPHSHLILLNRRTGEKEEEENRERPTKHRKPSWNFKAVKCGVN